MLHRRVLASSWLALSMLVVSTLPPAVRAEPQATPVPALRDLDGLSGLQSLFDREADKIRVVMLLSPTWPACIKAARWAQQELLQQFKSDDVRIYAVWFNMYPGDARTKWPGDLLTDTRVLHYWDQERAVGVQYLAQLPAMLDRRAAETVVPSADAMWDAFYVYGRNVKWDGQVPLPISWGYPIMVTKDRLVADLGHLLERR